MAGACAQVWPICGDGIDLEIRHTLAGSAESRQLMWRTIVPDPKDKPQRQKVRCAHKIAVAFQAPLACWILSICILKVCRAALCLIGPTSCWVIKDCQASGNTLRRPLCGIMW